MTDIREVHAFAFETFHQHKMGHWKIRWNRHAGTAGLTDYETRTVTFSATAMESWDWPEVENTVIHELAHVLVGPGQGHNRKWAKQVKDLGGIPQQYCPNFSGGSARFITQAGSPDNLMFLLGVIIASWIAAPELAPFVTAAAVFLGVAGYVRNARDPLPQAERESIERDVLLV